MWSDWARVIFVKETPHLQPTIDHQPSTITHFPQPAHSWAAPTCPPLRSHQTRPSSPRRCLPARLSATPRRRPLLTRSARLCLHRRLSTSLRPCTHSCLSCCPPLQMRPRALIHSI